MHSDRTKQSPDSRRTEKNTEDKLTGEHAANSPLPKPGAAHHKRTGKAGGHEKKDALRQTEAVKKRRRRIVERTDAQDKDPYHEHESHQPKVVKAGRDNGTDLLDKTGQANAAKDHRPKDESFSPSNTKAQDEMTKVTTLLK